MVLKLCCFFKVSDGQEICIVEAMKMQNKLLASRPGKVS